MRYCFIVLLNMVLCVSLAACTSRDVAPHTFHPAEHSWIVTEPGALLRDLPRRSAVSMLTPVQSAGALDFWRVPATSWISIEMGLVAREYVSPPRAARCYALLAVGINDALLVADMARRQGLEVSDDAVIARVAERIIGYSHPLRIDELRLHAAEAQSVGVWRSQASTGELEAGQQIGQAVAARVITWAQHDRAEEFTPFSDPAPSPGVWQRTPPRLWSALDPGWGNVRPIAMPSAAQMIAAPPPAWADATFVADRAAFDRVQRSLTAADRALARRWAAPMGSVTPAGQWLQIARQAIEHEQVDNRRAAEIYAALAVAMHDSFIACWYSKYTYLVARPISWMRATNPAWLSLIDTPPFPSYPSGHATVSGAASTLLVAYFPRQAAELGQQAEDAARSRVVGGIHWPIDGRNGLAQGRMIGDWVLTHTIATSNE